MSKMVKITFGIGLILFLPFLIYSFSPVCEFERAYAMCSKDPPSDEPCDTWIGTNYAGLNNGTLTTNQCRFFGTLSSYSFVAAGVTWLGAMLVWILRKLRGKRCS